MNTIADRIKRIVEEGRVPSTKSWAIKAGLSGSSIAQYLSRIRQGVDQNMGIQTVERLAQAAGISPIWLAFGAGTIEGGSADETELYATVEPTERRDMLRRMHGAIATEVADYLESIYMPGVRWTLLEWIEHAVRSQGDFTKKIGVFSEHLPAARDLAHLHKMLTDYNRRTKK